MARRLCEAGYAPAVFDVDASRRAAFEAIGASWADSPQADGRPGLDRRGQPADAGRGGRGADRGPGADPWQGRQVHRRHLDDRPEVSKRAAERLAGRAIQLVDAPVSGGHLRRGRRQPEHHGFPGAPQAYETVSGILRVIGRNLFYLGEEPGQAN